MSALDWMSKAECLGVNNPMWDDSTPTPDALRFCFRCPVRPQCAVYGVRRNYASDAGVLGATGVYDRQRIRERKTTMQKVWDLRLRDLVLSDWDDALAEDFARTMPRMEWA